MGQRWLRYVWPWFLQVNFPKSFSVVQWDLSALTSTGLLPVKLSVSKFYEKHDCTAVPARPSDDCIHVVTAEDIYGKDTLQVHT